MNDLRGQGSDQIGDYVVMYSLDEEDIELLKPEIIKNARSAVREANSGIRQIQLYCGNMKVFDEETGSYVDVPIIVWRSRIGCPKDMRDLGVIDV